jgi:hypothetical protein
MRFEFLTAVNMKIMALLDGTPYTLDVKAAGSFKMLVPTCQTI